VQLSNSQAGSQKSIQPSAMLLPKEN